MNPSSQSKMTVPTKTNSIHLSPLRRGLLLIPLVFVCFGLSPAARAVLPAPDGGYLGANTAEGKDALFSLLPPLGPLSRANTAIGFNALRSNTFGSNNTATGSNTLFDNTTGGDNTATGVDALFDNTTGSNNTATGSDALNNNTTGNNNTATGSEALISNTTGGNNTATGSDALNNNTTGNNNIALGSAAGFNLTTGDNNIDIGNRGVAGEANTIRIGRNPSRIGKGQTATFIAGINGAAVAGPAVVVNASGQLGVAVSSARYKNQIKPMDKASEAILALKPVTFRYKKELDPEGTPQFGLVAEEVEKVNPDLVAHDRDGKAYTVRYEAVNAMLLNEFLKEHRKVEEHHRKVEEHHHTMQELEATITQLKSTLAQQQKDFQATVAQQQKQIEALTAGLQKVSAQIEMSRSAPQMAVNDQ